MLQTLPDIDGLNDLVPPHPSDIDEANDIIARITGQRPAPRTSARTYDPKVEEWRQMVSDRMPAALKNRPDADTLIDKSLWTSQFEADGDQFRPGDSGAAYGAWQSHHVRKGASREEQVDDMWRLVQQGGFKAWGDEGATWFNPATERNETFGALSRHPYPGQGIAKLTPIPNAKPGEIDDRTPIPNTPNGYVPERENLGQQREIHNGQLLPEGAPGEIHTPEVGDVLGAVAGQKIAETPTTARMAVEGPEDQSLRAGGTFREQIQKDRYAKGVSAVGPRQASVLPAAQLIAAGASGLTLGPDLLPETGAKLAGSGLLGGTARLAGSFAKGLITQQGAQSALETVPGYSKQPQWVQELEANAIGSEGGLKRRLLVGALATGGMEAAAAGDKALGKPIPEPIARMAGGAIVPGAFDLAEPHLRGAFESAVPQAEKGSFFSGIGRGDNLEGEARAAGEREAAGEPVNAEPVTRDAAARARGEVNLGGMGSAISDNLYQKIFSDLQANKTMAHSGIPEQVAEAAFQRGRIQSAGDVKNIMSEAQRVMDSDLEGNAKNKALNDLLGGPTNPGATAPIRGAAGESENAEPVRPLPGQAGLFGGVVNNEGTLAPVEGVDARPRMGSQRGEGFRGEQGGLQSSAFSREETGQTGQMELAEGLKPTSETPAAKTPTPTDEGVTPLAPTTGIARDRRTVPVSDLQFRSDLFQLRDADPGKPFGQKRVDQLVRTWDPGKFEPPDVVPDPENPGKYIVYSGHHRTAAFSEVNGPESKMEVVVNHADIKDPAQLANIRQKAIDQNFTTAVPNFRESARAVTTKVKEGKTVPEVADELRMTMGKVEGLQDANRLGSQALDRVVNEPALESYAVEIGRGMRVFDINEEDANGLFNRIANGTKVSRPTPAALRETINKFGALLNSEAAAKAQGGLFGDQEVSGKKGGLLALIDENARIRSQLTKEANAVKRAQQGVKRIADLPAAGRADKAGAERLVKLGQAEEKRVRDALTRNEDNLNRAARGEPPLPEPQAPKPPSSPPTDRAPIGDEHVEQLIAAVQEAGAVRPDLLQRRSEELSKRVGAAADRLQRSGVPAERAFSEARQELRGQLADPSFVVPPEFKADALHQAIVDATKAKEVSFFTGSRADEGLAKIKNGIVPAPNEVEALGQVFGPRLQQAIEDLGDVFKVQRTVEQVIKHEPILITFPDGTPITPDMLADLLKAKLPNAPEAEIDTVAKRLIDSKRIKVATTKSGARALTLDEEGDSPLTRAINGFDGVPPQSVPPDEPNLGEPSFQPSVALAKTDFSDVTPPSPLSPTQRAARIVDGYDHLIPDADNANAAEIAHFKERLREALSSGDDAAVAKVMDEGPLATRTGASSELIGYKAPSQEFPATEPPLDPNDPHQPSVAQAKTDFGDVQAPAPLDPQQRAAAILKGYDHLIPDRASAIPAEIVHFKAKLREALNAGDSAAVEKLLNEGPLSFRTGGTPATPPNGPRTPAQTAFGGKGWQAGTPLWKTTARAIGDIITLLPRVVQTAFDHSTILRQGGLLIRHQQELWPNILKSLHGGFNEGYAIQRQAEIERAPYNPRNLEITKWGPNAQLSEREEGFISRLADKIPGIKQSQRMAVLFLNGMRSDLANTFARGQMRAIQNGATPTNFARDMEIYGNYLNRATGRGNLGGLESSVGALNTLFYSARRNVAMIQAPAYVFSRSAAVRKEAMLDLVGFVGMGAATLEVAHLAGADVGLDPNSGDFGKIRIGNTRVDIWGGYSQLARMIYQVGDGLIKDPNDPRFIEPMETFLRNKLSPEASFLVDWRKGKNEIGQPFGSEGETATALEGLFGKDLNAGKWGNELIKRLVPLSFGGLVEALNDDGLRGLASASTGLIGTGTQTYQTQTDYRDEVTQRLGFGKKFDDLQQDYGRRKQVMDIVEQEGHGYPKTDNQKAADTARAGFDQEQAGIDNALQQGTLTQKYSDATRFITAERLGSAKLQNAFFDEAGIKSTSDFAKRFGGLVDGYRAVNVQDENGQRDFDATKKAQQKYLAGLNAKDRELFNSYLAYNESKKSDSQKEYDQYQQKREAIGYYDIDPKDPNATKKRAALDAANPDLDVKNWYFNGGVKDGNDPTLNSVEAVNLALAKNLPNREVKYSGLSRPVNQSPQIQQLWRDQGQRIANYMDNSKLVATYGNREAATLYSKPYAQLDAAQQANVTNHIKAGLRASSPVLTALLAYMGESIQNNQIVIGDADVAAALKALQSRYGATPPKPGVRFVPAKN